MTNTVNQQPAAASLQLTDYLLGWQAAQSPPTRKVAVSALAPYYALLTGATFTGAVTISSGGITATGNSKVTGTLTATGNVTANTLAVTGAATLGLRDYLAGLILSNDGSLPNSVIDVSAGVCTDAANVASIVLGAFTKSTAGPWASGTGSNGMGNGLTVANSTWYHVFAIINAGTPDVYFDTSVTAANAPAGTSAFRRIGSFRTNGSAHIIPFSHNGDEFLWASSNASLDVNVSNLGTVSTSFGLTVPPGVKVNALVRGAMANAAVGASVLVSAVDEGVTVVNTPANNATAVSQVANTGVSFTLNVRVSTGALIKAVSDTANTTLRVVTYGWVDTRGRFV